MHDPRVQAIPPGRRDSGARERGKKRKPNATGRKKASSIYEAQKLASYTFAPFSLEANLVEQLPVVPERESGSQTDAFIVRKSTNQKGVIADGTFQRPKVGIDSSTQIEDSDKLFNFDVEALAEVKEEQEMMDVKKEHELLLAQREDAARADRELETKAKEAYRVKAEAKQANELKRQRCKVMTEKMLAWQFAHRTLVPQVIEDATAILEKTGVFYNPLHRDLFNWLSEDVYQGADAKVRLRLLSAQLLDGNVAQFCFKYLYGLDLIMCLTIAIDILVNSLRQQTILTQLLHNESEAIVRFLLRDPLPCPAAVALEGGEEGVTQREIQIIGPILLSRQDRLDTIEQKIQ
ncbi:Ankyrin repeat domain-containing protein 50, partial [Globisporangium splendens]